MPKAKESVLEIDFSALTHNFKYLKSKIEPQTKFMAVVKAFAYGSDSVEVARHLEKLNVDYFAVAYTKEGVVLRDAGITKPILVLHPLSINYETLIDRCLEPSLYSYKVLNEFIKVAETKSQKEYPVHIKFNTGLNRLGFEAHDVDELVALLKKTTAIKVTSIFSHLAASEDLDEEPFTRQQIATTKAIAKDFEQKIGYKPWLHICNTSGILNYPEAHCSMVRSGIGLYGFGNSPKEDKNLKPMASLKTIISQIHNIEKGETVGYNRVYTSKGIEKTATIPMGYADGISRAFGSENGFVFINDQKAFIIGTICMDMIMINVTGIDCKEGDEVIVFNSEHQATSIAESLGSISYEIITAVSPRVKRVYLNRI